VTPFFPHETIEWRVHEPAAFRRLSLSLPAMAVVAGILVRLYRLAVLALAPADSLWIFIGAYSAGLLLVLGLATAHLGNYPVRHWLWRAPLFGALEAASFAAAGALLVALGVDREGTGVMGWSGWRADLLSTFVLHTAVVCGFALILAVVVQAVRRLLLRREHREHTLEAIHEEHAREHAEREHAKTMQ
jgi:hypothetical protein